MFIVILSAIFIVQSLFTLLWMLYAWERVGRRSPARSSYLSVEPKYSFSALVPARHEEAVIKDTIRAIDRIDYPENLKEIIILCRADDIGTIAKSEEIIGELNQKNIRLVVFDSFPINKPHGLNYGLSSASGEIVTIFDAEDEPSGDIYRIINSILVKENVDVVQSGIQLMNFLGHWLSPFNVMEYYLWFKSVLRFFLKMGKVTPLGGNTVFFRKNWLIKIGGWDENSLTEDADMALRLSEAGAKIKVIYDEKNVTREETPASTSGFIKQRTRWNQGFLQLFLKGDWLYLGAFRQKLMALYFLLSPLIQAFLVAYTPFAVWAAFTQKLPVVSTLFSFIPLYLFLLQVVIYNVGLFEFTRVYRLKFPYWMPVFTLMALYPYQILLMLSSFRALVRIVLNEKSWEKTLHVNEHRRKVNLSYA